MEKIGQVVTTDNDMAKVEIRRASACGEKCGSCSGGCSSTGIYIDAENVANAKPGQFVKIEVETGTVMKAAFLAYAVPLFMLVIGVISGSYIHRGLGLNISSELFSFLWGMLLMILSYGGIKAFDRSYKSQNRIKYKITKKL